MEKNIKYTRKRIEVEEEDPAKSSFHWGRNVVKTPILLMMPPARVIEFLIFFFSFSLLPHSLLL
jgi:hypothetical protein